MELHIEDLLTWNLKDYGEVVAVEAYPLKDSPWGVCIDKTSSKYRILFPKNFYSTLYKIQYSEYEDLKYYPDNFVECYIEEKKCRCDVYIELYNSSFNTSNPEPVDLGLSVLWSNMNVGASNPVECGNYFCYGVPSGAVNPNVSLDLALHNKENDEDLDDDWDEDLDDDWNKNGNYDWYEEPSNDWEEDYVYPRQNIIHTKLDVAHENLGGDWRMPTIEEYKELISKCSLENCDINGHNVCKVVGPNGNYIYFPAGGSRIDLSIIGMGHNGNYWAGTVDEYENCLYFSFQVSSSKLPFTIPVHGSLSVSAPETGMLIRPVLPKKHLSF